VTRKQALILAGSVLGGLFGAAVAAVLAGRAVDRRYDFDPYLDAGGSWTADEAEAMTAFHIAEPRRA